jgi:hypothetical protein
MAILGLALAGCERDGKRADLVFINGAEPETLDPAIITGQPEGRVVNALFEGLCAYDESGQAVPGVAERWDISPDGKTYTFHLRPTAKWSDGSALTARDFVASWKRTLTPETGSQYNYHLFPIKNAQAFAEGKMTDFTQVGVRAVDDQKLVYETALALADRSRHGKKNVLIVRGGPGTGKSVVAINLLVELTKRKHFAQYISKNSAPREVYKAKLTGTLSKSRFDKLFTGSGGYHEVPHNTFDTLIVDEAHRLNEKSGLYANLGENQIKEITEAAKCTIFFIDEDQRIHFKDIGRVDAIQKWARAAGAKVHELERASQFRCNGSDGYLAWLDNTLGVRPTANPSLEGIDYEFRVIDSPQELREEIFSRNAARNRARMVAGYCWKWVSKNQKNLWDFEFPDSNFQAKWNLSTDGSLWILKPDSVSEIGCIHTCQGLEVDYVGVIIGPDFLIRDGQIVA